MKHLLTAASALALGFAGAAHGEVISLYDFSGSTYSSSDSSTVTSSDLTVGSDLLADTNTAILATGGNPDEHFNWRYGPLGDDIVFTDGTVDSLTFTLTPTGGTLDFSSITFDLINKTGGWGIRAYVYSSLADGTIDDENDDLIGQYTTAGGSGSWEPVSFDLSAYTGVAGPVDFQIEFFTGGNNGVHHNGIDNITVNATVIPEPTSLALLGLGGLLAARRRRG